MSDFKSYNSIENSYNQKSIMKHLGYNPELSGMRYVAREKLDGANIQLLISPNEEMKVGKRSQFIGRGDTFFDVWNTLDKINYAVDSLRKYSERTNKSIRVFGEIYGPGINGRINYGPDKKIALFDIYVDDMLLAQQDFESVMEECRLGHMLPPLIAYTLNLQEALDLNENFNSHILGIDNNKSEGLVIQPYSKVIRSPNGERFILKKKSSAFEEKMKSKQSKEPKTPLSGSELQALSSFKDYINNNRVLSCFSKHGPIESEKQIGDYIRLVLEDAKMDFLKDHPDLILSDDASKVVFNVGRDIVLLLKAHL